MNKSRIAFTLAEVLITLLVIGVVAGLTVPNIINDTQNAEMKGAWKKSYSDLAQATIKLSSDNAGSLKGLCPADDHLCLKNLFVPYLSYIKSCDHARDGCWLSNTVVKQYNGNNYPNNFSSYPALTLQNGSIFLFLKYDSDSRSISGVYTGYKAIATIFVDVNGHNKPNTIGKDIFGIYLLENRILPRGLKGDINYGTGCPDAWYGWGCSAEHLYK